MYVDRMFLLVIGLLANVGLAVYGLLERPPDFASYMLAIFITNLMLYTTFYIIMKLRHGEKILYQPLFYIALASLSMGAAMYFFINKAITWRVRVLYFSYSEVSLRFLLFLCCRKERQNLVFTIKNALFWTSTTSMMFGISFLLWVYSFRLW